MTANFNVNLFLTDSEREELLKLHDTLYDIDYDTEEQMAQGEKWARIISRLIFGKVLYKNSAYPMALIPRKPDESID